MIKNVLDLRHGATAGTEQMQQNAWVECAAPGCHRNAVQCGKTHTGIVADTRFKCTQAGAAAEVCDDHFALGCIGCAAHQFSGDKFVR